MLKEKFNKVRCNIITARATDLRGIIVKKHNGDLKEKMLAVVISFTVFAVVSACIYAIVNKGSMWVSSQANGVFK